VGSQPLQFNYENEDLRSDSITWLSNIVIDEKDLILAARATSFILKKLESYSNSTNISLDKYWLWLMGLYLKVSIRQNLIAIILARKFIRKKKFKYIEIVRDGGELFSIDFYKPGSYGLDNVVALYMENFCQAKKIPYRVKEVNKCMNSLKYWYYRNIYSFLVHYFRCVNLFKDSCVKPRAKVKVSNVLVIERASRFSALLKNVTNALKINNVINIKQQSYSDVNGVTLNLDPAASWLNKTIFLYKLITLTAPKVLLNRPQSFHDQYIQGYIKAVRAHRNLPKIYSYVASTVFKKIKPVLLVATDESSLFNRIYFYEAGKRNIKTIAIQHGEITEIDYILLHQRKYTDIYIVSSLEAKNQFNNWGTLSEIKYYNPNAEGVNYYGGSLRLKKIILAATCLDNRVLVKLIEKILIGLNEINKDFQVYLKPHPLDSVDVIEQLTKNFKLKIIKHNSFHEELITTDLVISISSSIALEVALKGIPVIMHNEASLELTALRNKAFNNFIDLKKLFEYVSELNDDEVKYRKLRDSFEVYQSNMHASSDINNLQILGDVVLC
jgi:hypothetical protein